MESRNKAIISENTELTTTELNTNEAENAAAENETTAFSSLENPVIPKKNRFTRFFKGELFTTPLKVLCFIFLGALIAYILSRFIPTFAEFWTRYPAQGLRFVMAKLTGWIPFSLAECLIFSLPIVAIAYITLSTISTKRDESDSNFYRWLRPMLSVVLVHKNRKVVRFCFIPASYFVFGNCRNSC